MCLVRLLAYIIRLEAVLFPSFLYTCYFLYKRSSIYLMYIMYSHDFSNSMPSVYRTLYVYDG